MDDQEHGNNPGTDPSDALEGDEDRVARRAAEDELIRA